MLAGTDAAARVTCEVSRYSSLFGKLAVSRYTCTAMSIDFCQTSNSRCEAGTPPPFPCWLFPIPYYLFPLFYSPSSCAKTFRLVLWPGLTRALGLMWCTALLTAMAASP